MKVKRILWLLSHVALLDMEPAVFEELGYEVYTPKIPLFDISAGITYKYDKTLSLPQDVIERLNQVDFFQRNIDGEVYEILNEYFDVCIVGSTPDLLRNIINKFKGVIAYRAFGRISAEESHTLMIAKTLGVSYLKKIEDMGKRFFFLQISENIDEIECECFRRRSLYVPIGFKKGQLPVNEWKGTENKILFVCPRIGISDYFKNVYNNFKHEFKEFPYIVAGSQPVRIEKDENITGYLGTDEYKKLFLDCKVMFYHSQEPRHIHYHPLEAIMVGMPLIYMAGGQLDVLGGDKLPGRCKDYSEARKKLKKVLRGDRAFINKVVKSQCKLVEKYNYDYCKDKWEDFFKELDDIEIKDTDKPKKIAFIVPAEYTGGVLDYSIRLAQAVYRGAKEKNVSLEVVFAYLDHENYKYEEFTKTLEEEGIKTRKYTWESMKIEHAEEVFELFKYNVDFHKVYGDSMELTIANDGMNYFMDCDYVVLTADRVCGQLFSLVPFGVVSHDYIQRILPDMFGDFFERAFIDLTRKSDAIFTTTEINKYNCINYIGVSRDRINLLPLFFEEIGIQSEYDKNTNYFVWSTNVSPHKNHITVLKALEEYYLSGGKLMCYVTGAQTEKFDIEEQYEVKIDEEDDEKKDYISEIRKFIKSSRFLKDNIIIKGELPKKQYLMLLAKARFFLHAGYADNGNGTAFDAAMLNIPTLSSDYPAMRNLDEKIGLGMVFFPIFDYCALAERFNDFERGLIKHKEMKREELIKHTVSDVDLCKEIYCIVANNGAL